MADITSRSTRGLLVGGAVSLWVVGLLWTLQRKGVLETSPPDAVSDIVAPSEAGEGSTRSAGRTQAEADEPVSEITVEARSSPRSTTPSGPAIGSEPETALDPTLVIEEPAVPTYSVWFESERNLGVCKVSWEGGSKTANLHVAARLPEGPLNFSYRCGKHSGRGSIDVKPKRTNGVLFCQESGGVRVEVVRSKDERCASG